MVNQSWKRWLREYLPTLQRRDNWWNDIANLRVGNFVLMVELSEDVGMFDSQTVVRITDSPDGIIK
ncbi:hypothetical protein TTRE_0000707701 [Trichuris trichiura]|uniref:DUF5641 domain-containing protein n=1 Tax=Trichuris trichiura TaxID=36087 RepID=A0A077ZEF3_TRITR|nr:hypothetical protein TTRE_0000707701 [Trichuris trichiura]